MSRAIATEITSGGHVTVYLPNTPQALEEAADRLEAAVAPPSVFELGLLCARLMRRLAILERAAMRGLAQQQPTPDETEVAHHSV